MSSSSFALFPRSPQGRITVVSSTLSSAMKRLAILGVLGGFTVLLTLPDATAQGDGKDSKIQPAAKAQSDVRARGTGATPRTSVVREGFTRPGNPPDEVLGNGKIRYVAWDPANREEVIG